jgi:ribosomal-protein-alanine N-acetyltransferase
VSPVLVQPVIAPGDLRRHPQPTLTIDELVIRPWRPDDAPAVEAAYGDPAIQRWHTQSMTAEESLAWVHEQPRRWDAETGAGWAVTEDEAVVGRVGLRSLDLAEGSAEVGYWVLPQHRGRAIAPRVLTGVTRWLFDEVGFHRVTLNHSVENTASCRVAHKAGFAPEGTARQQLLHADGWHDMHLHARLMSTPG